MNELVSAREIDMRSLCVMLERGTGGSKLKKEKEIRRIQKAYREGHLYLPPNEPEQHQNWRCQARMMCGDFTDWRGWEYRDEWAATLWFNRPYPAPPWNGLPTECLYVIGEQGVGDEIFFASCLPDAVRRSKRVILECQPRLQSVFERSFGIETVPANIKGTKRFKIDMPSEVTAWMSLADLPRMWRSLPRHFPGTAYIKPDPEQVERFRAYRGRTGISWRGAQGEERELVRLHPEAVSLQYDMEWDEDVERPDLDLRNDIEGVLGLIANLSKVVCVSTSAAHFAASMGIETHVVIADFTTGRRSTVLPFKWICGDSGRTPWYGSASVYRNINAYRARCFPKGQAVGGEDRREHRHSPQEPVMAAG